MGVTEAEQLLHAVINNEPDLAAIKTTPELAAAERFAIYRNSYVWRLHNVLVEDYPKLLQFIGSAEFNKMAQAYIKFYPSEHFNLRYFSARLSEYLQRLGQNFLAELASFEWQLNLALDRSTVAALDFDYLQQVPAAQWPELCFKFHPSVSLLPIKYNNVAIWQAIEQEQAVPEVQQISATVLIWRDTNNQIKFNTLNEFELSFAQVVGQQQSFAELCTLLEQQFGSENILSQINLVLQNWISAGILTI